MICNSTTFFGWIIKNHRYHFTVYLHYIYFIMFRLCGILFSEYYIKLFLLTHVHNEDLQ